MDAAQRGEELMAMPSGGHANSGPPPDPNALRRERPADKATWIDLPASGRDGEAPVWPLTEQSPREQELWADFWSRPQAVMWERLDQRYEVAMCVRMLERAEAPRSSIELQKVVRQYFDSLGLSVQGMLRNRWRLSDMGVAGSAATPAARKAAPRRSVQSRLKVVPVAETGD